MNSMRDLIMRMRTREVHTAAAANKDALCIEESSFASFGPLKQMSVHEHRELIQVTRSRVQDYC